MRKPYTLRLRVLACCILISTTAYSQRYRVGDVVENFSLINRETNQPLSLHELEGNIIFLEWFAYWCPFCQAAAQDVKDGIVDYYKERGGNANGVPVLHVGINLEGGAGADPFTQAFVDRYGLGLVLNDFNRALANRFQGGGQPIFAIINGLPNSPNAKPWELLYTRLGYGDFNQPISTFRQAIDSVQAGPNIAAPSITAQPQAIRVGTGSELMLSATASGEQLSYQWLRDGAVLPEQTDATLRIENAKLSDAGSYVVTVSNPAGEVSSDAAIAEVVLSLRDYLIQSGLAGSDLEANADPDRDGHANAFEYLARSDPNDPLSVPNINLQFSHEDGVPAIRIRVESHPDTIGYRLAARFWSYPAEAGTTTLTLPLGETIDHLQAIPPAAKTYLARLQAIPQS